MDLQLEQQSVASALLNRTTVWSPCSDSRGKLRLADHASAAHSDRSSDSPDLSATLPVIEGPFGFVMPSTCNTGVDIDRASLEAYLALSRSTVWTGVTP